MPHYEHKQNVEHTRHKLDHPKFEPHIWGPHYWFFLHSVAESYPEYPNDITKRKYYDLIMNMPIFIPNEKIGDRFATFLNQYPVSPYLDCRDSFIRWVNFIHNKINIDLGKEEIPLEIGRKMYYDKYNSSPLYFNDTYMSKRNFYVNMAIISGLLGGAYFLYKS